MLSFALRSILLLTDGSSEDVTNLVKSRNIPDIDATVFSFTLGDGADTTIPRKVAEATGGIHTHIEDGDNNLLAAMSSYYLYYAFSDSSDNSEMVVTSPYLDFGTGVAMITMALPVYFDEFFIGVLGVDIPLTLLSETTGNVKIGRNSYLFVVNEEEEVIFHPRLANPLTTTFSVGDTYNPVYISDVEPEEFNVAEMIDADAGSQKIEGTVGIPVCGRPLYIGFSCFDFSACFQLALQAGDAENLLYFYQKVGPTSLTLNIVIFTDADTEKPNIPGFGLISSPGTKCSAEEQAPYHCLAPFVLYHDLPLANSCSVDWYSEAGIQYSSAHSDWISEDNVMWYLQAGGWGSPSAAVHGQPTCDQLNALHTLTNRLGNPFAREMPFGGFREELWTKIFSEIKVLSSLTQFWKSDYLASDSVFFYLYFATYQGLFIMYPAQTMGATYNPLIRPWYRLAATYPDLLVVTTPYLDFTSGQLIATGATAIMAPNTTDILGVAAFDYKFSEFLDYFDETLKAGCQKSDGHYCYLMDTNAFLLYYDGIVDDMGDDDISHKFFGDVEPTLMQDMLDIGFFIKHTHSNYIDDSQDISYSADEGVYQSMRLNELPRNFGYNSGTYTVHQITGTNLYFVHVDDWSLSMMYPMDCPDNSACPSVRSPGCIRDDEGDCLSIVEDICQNPDTPAQDMSTCSAIEVNEQSLIMLEDGVKSDFCATCFDDDCATKAAWKLPGWASVLITLASICFCCSCSCIVWRFWKSLKKCVNISDKNADEEAAGSDKEQ